MRRTRPSMDPSVPGHETPAAFCRLVTGPASGEALEDGWKGRLPAVLKPHPPTSQRGPHESGPNEKSASGHRSPGTRLIHGHGSSAELREVVKMVGKQTKPDRGAREEPEDRERPNARRRPFAVVAAIVVAVAAGGASCTTDDGAAPPVQ